MFAISTYAYLLCEKRVGLPSALLGNLRSVKLLWRTNIGVVLSLVVDFAGRKIRFFSLLSRSTENLYDSIKFNT